MPTWAHLRRLVADGAVDGGLVVVEPAYAAEVDQLDGVADLDQVVGLEVAVDQAEIVQVLEGGQHLEDVGQRLVHRQRVVAATGLPHPVLQDVLERDPADVLHHDVAGTVVGDEVVDLHDQRVLDLRQELLLDDGHREGVGVAGVEQTLQHHPPVGDVLVLGEVDPAETAVGEAARHLVLVRHQVTWLELRGEGELVAALGAEALGAPGLTVSTAADRRSAARADALVLRHHRVDHDRLGGVDRRGRRHPGQAGAEPGRAQPLGA